MPQSKPKSSHVSLTESFCSRLRPAAATQVFDYYDTNTPNLSLRLRPPSRHHRNGLLSWRYGYRLAGKADVLTFGHHPAWSSSMAHARAREARVALDKGLNPREALYPHQEAAPAPVALPPADTVKAMFRRYEPELDAKSTNHRNNVTAYFERFVLPTWGGRDIHSLSRREIVDLLKVVKVKSGPVASNRCAAAISAWFNFLIKDGILESSPATALPKTEEKPRERSLSVPELIRVWQAADRLGGPAGRFVQMLIALPMRRDEASGMRRDEIDDTRQEWILPAGRNKSGRDFLVPLSTLAQDILAACPDTGQYYFSVSGKHPLGGFSRIKQQLDAEIAKQPGPPPVHFTFHDLRRSVRTALSALGVDHLIREKVINHTAGKMERTYDRHDYAAEKAQALQLWADHFALAGTQPGTLRGEELEAAE